MPASYSRNLKKIETAINYTFKNQALLLEALTHSSYSNEHPEEAAPYNERLEFLGDAVLGLSVVEELFKAEQRLTESEMAKLKAFLVSKTVLSDLAREINLGASLRLGKGEEASGGRDKDNILADALEALFGAVFLDSDYTTVKKLIISLMGNILTETIRTRQSHDYKTDLQELTQQRYGCLPEYRIVKEEGKEHKKTFTIEVLINGEPLGTGKGRSKKEAQMNAARKALQFLRSQTAEKPFYKKQTSN